MRSVANQESQVAEDAFSKQSLDSKRHLNDQRNQYYPKHIEMLCRSSLTKESQILR